MSSVHNTTWTAASFLLLLDSHTTHTRTQWMTFC